MSVLVKIVMAGINVACLINTLIYPSNATPFVILTTIASVVTWAFTTKEKSPAIQRGLNLYIGYASVLSAICIVLGTSAKLQPLSQGVTNKYMFIFDPNAVLLGSRYFNYLYFAIFMFLSVTALMIFEIVAAINSTKIESTSLPRYVAGQVAKYV